MPRGRGRETLRVVFFAPERILGTKVSPWSPPVTPRTTFSRFWLDFGSVFGSFLTLWGICLAKTCAIDHLSFHGFGDAFRGIGPSAVAEIGAAQCAVLSPVSKARRQCYAHQYCCLLITAIRRFKALRLVLEAPPEVCCFPKATPPYIIFEIADKYASRYGSASGVSDPNFIDMLWGQARGNERWGGKARGRQGPSRWAPWARIRRPLASLPLAPGAGAGGAGAAAFTFQFFKLVNNREL